MSTADVHFERMQDALALSADAARRLAIMLRSGMPFLPSLSAARSVLQNGLNTAAQAAEDLGVELSDTRWVGPVALMHNAATQVRQCSAHEAAAVATLVDLLRAKIERLRNTRSTESVTIRFH